MTKQIMKSHIAIVVVAVLALLLSLGVVGVFALNDSSNVYYDNSMAITQEKLRDTALSTVAEGEGNQLQDVSFAGMPTANFEYAMYSQYSLGSIVARQNNAVLAIKRFELIDALPTGIVLEYSGGYYYIQGTPSELYQGNEIQIKAVFSGGDWASIPIYIESKRQPLKNVIIDQDTYSYTASEIIPTIEVHGKGGEVLSIADYSIKYYRDDVVTEDLTSAGNIRIEITGKGNYSGVVRVTYFIQKITMTDEHVLDIADVVYTGVSQPPVLEFVGYGENTHDVICRRGENTTNDFTNAGTISVEITFKGNYQGRITKEYVILPVVADSADITISQNAVFDGKSHAPAIMVDAKWQKDIDYNISITQDGQVPKGYINAGQYDIVVEFINNVSGRFVYVYVIDPKAINVQLTGALDYVYDGSAKQSTAYIVGENIAGVPNKYVAGVDYDIAFYRGDQVTQNFTDVGLITVKLVMKGNYIGETSTKYSIFPPSLGLINPDGIIANIYTPKGFGLNDSFSMSIVDKPPFSIRYKVGEALYKTVNITMITNGESANMLSIATVKIKTELNRKNIKGIRIEYIQDGVQISKQANVDSEGHIVFDIKNVGDIAIIIETELEKEVSPYMYLIIGGGALLLIIIIVIIVYFLSKRTGVRTILPNRRR